MLAMAARLPPDPETQSYLSSQESMSCEGSVEDAFDDEPSSIILTGTAPVLQSPSEDTPEQRSHQSVRRKVSPEKIGRMRVKRSLTIVACVLCRRKHGKVRLFADAFPPRPSRLNADPRTSAMGCGRHVLHANY